MSSPVKIFGESDCRKSAFYLEQLSSEGIAHEFVDVTDAANMLEVKALQDAFPEVKLKFPTVLVNDKRLSNPTTHELEKALTRVGLMDLGVVHEPKAKRFIQYRSPKDNIISYGITSKGKLRLSFLKMGEFFTESKEAAVDASADSNKELQQKKTNAFIEEVLSTLLMSEFQNFKIVIVDEQILKVAKSSMKYASFVE